jgi:hypothetical protein
MVVSSVCAGFYPVVQSQLVPSPVVVTDVSRYGGDTVPGSMNGANLTYAQDVSIPPPPHQVVPVVRIRNHHAIRHMSSQQLAQARAKLERSLRQTNLFGRKYNEELARMKGKRAALIVNETPD